MTDESLKEEILINVTPSEVRAALLETGVLQEVYIERSARRGVISNIYKGHVSRVLPGMQAAFVDIGLQRTAFLHASDIARVEGRGDLSEDDLPSIRDLVREGDELLVQVVKDPLGNKGAVEGRPAAPRRRPNSAPAPSRAVPRSRAAPRRCEGARGCSASQELR